MVIRQLTAEEFAAGLALDEYSFHFKLSEEDKEREKLRYKPERNWGFFEDGELGAQLTLLPLSLYIQGNAVPMGGIAGVSTWPENRRQGMVAKLLTHVLQTMNEAGQTISMLHPFLIPFYRRYGWEVCCEYKEYVLTSTQYPPRQEIQGIVKRDRATVEELDELYNAFAAGYNGTLKRDRDWWEHSVLQGDRHTAVFYAGSGEPGGYILYKIGNRELTVEEFVYLNEAARQGLLTFISNHDATVDQVKLTRVPADDLLPFLLPNPRVQQHSHPYFMARLVNAQSFVGNYIFAKYKGDSAVIIGIEDEHAPWNNGLWRWTVDQLGRGSLTAVTAEEKSHKADLQCGIGALGAILLGYKRPAGLARAGILRGNEQAVQWLEARVPQAQTALFDFF
ncbi:GNAT family N-acetyltransferase [Paenibacillus tengchongensis]|uniref:GNAT family N-acetyltransferase n=1 Tax=Paenibacillus tengchongensis TaxID=2608684 RepID=UPI00124E6A1E|nr:GNAT family N-acetyltransferase [Paenibacillus tengchongensis]